MRKLLIAVGGIALMGVAPASVQWQGRERS